jgi:hypothetical protein
MRFGVLLVLLLVVGVIVNAWSYLGEAHVERKELKDFPQTIGAWQRTGNDQILDDQTMQVLRASDYLLRDFRKPEGQVANLYVGYYATQRTGATYHSPLNCLPGSGWQLSEPGKATIALPDGTSFIANKYVIKSGDYKSLMIYTVLDSVRLRRSNGAMVRVTVPIGDSEASAERVAIDFASAASTVLPQYVP